MSYFEFLERNNLNKFDGVMDLESDSDILEANLNSGSLILNINNGINTSSNGSPEAIITIDEIVNSNEIQSPILPLRLTPSGFDNIKLTIHASSF